MAFISIEDLYGTEEIICFEQTYQKAVNHLIVDNVVLVEGRLSIREDDETKIVAREILDFSDQIESEEKSPMVLSIDITDLEEEKKDHLRGAIRFFSGEKNNIRVQIVANKEIKPCGAIYITPEIIAQFEELVGKDRIELK